MPGDIVMTKNQEDEKNNLNNNDSHINRGMELMLRKGRKKSEEPKSFQMKFGKMVSLFKREIHFHFDFHLDIRKK